LKKPNGFARKRLERHCLNAFKKQKVTKKSLKFYDSYYGKEPVDFLKVHFSDTCDSEDAAKMLSGLGSGSEVELHAAVTIESWKIILNWRNSV
jgi:DNA relaxase NicK